MRLDVPFDVHAHEGDELDKARVDPAKGTGIAQWHGSRQRAFEPGDRSLLREAVDLRRIHSRVDRAGHQGHGARLCWIGGLRHYRDRCQHCNAGLTDRENVRGWPDHFQKFDQVISIFVDGEATGGKRNVACVVPVGDEDIVLRQHSAHCRAQQRREVPRKRRHQEHARLCGRHVLAEVQQRREQRARYSLFTDLDLAAIYGDRLDAKGRPHVGQPGARDKLIDRREIAQRRIIGKDRRAARVRRPAGPAADRRHDVRLHLIGEIQQCPTPAVARAVSGQARAQTTRLSGD